MPDSASQSAVVDLQQAAALGSPRNLVLARLSGGVPIKLFLRIIHINDFILKVSRSTDV
jgi:hypothetical protein